MAVNVTRPDYNYQLPIWNKCRHVIEGQERMHVEGELYLPRLSGQSDDDYNAYVERALFYNATSRTVDAMTGLLFRKPPVMTVPKGMEPWLENIDMNGNSLMSFVEDLADEILEVGRFGLLVEHPEVNVIDNSIEITQAEAEQQNLRPFFAKYAAECIINWKVTTVNNRKTLSMVVLKEIYEEAIDEFEVSDDYQYRVLDIEPTSGNYRQRIFRATDEDEKNLVQIEPDKFPMKNGAPMKYIPFFIVGPKGLCYDIEKPPILDLVNVNVSHYKTTADLEHGAHFTGLPTAVVIGHSMGEGDDPLKIGSAAAWVFSEPDADAKYLEFTGAGLEALEKRIDKKENQMATLGARMLASEKAAAETAETHTIKRQGENSALASIAHSIDAIIVKALTIMSEWSGIPGEISYKINKDFIPTKMGAQELLALFQVYQGGGMAFSDFIENLQKGEIINSEKTSEQIKEEIDLTGPIGGSFNG
jgi:hypothetical protein